MILNQRNNNSSAKGGERVTFNFSDSAYKLLIPRKFPFKQGKSII